MDCVQNSVKFVLSKKLTNKEVERVLEIENLSFFSPWSEHVFFQEMKNSYSKFFLAKLEKDIESRVVGYLCFWRILDEIHILNLAIHPQFRRQGIASGLLRRLLYDPAYGRVKTYTLEVRKSNQPAINLYESLGFKKAGIRKEYYQDTAEDAFIMSFKRI